MTGTILRCALVWGFCIILPAYLIARSFLDALS